MVGYFSLLISEATQQMVTRDVGSYLDNATLTDLKAAKRNARIATARQHAEGMTFIEQVKANRAKGNEQRTRHTRKIPSRATRKTY